LFHNGYGETGFIIGEKEIMAEKDKNKQEQLHAVNRRCEIKILGKLE